MRLIITTGWFGLISCVAMLVSIQALGKARAADSNSKCWEPVASEQKKSLKIKGSATVASNPLFEGGAEATASTKSPLESIFDGGAVAIAEVKRLVPCVKTGVRQERCLISWDDSHQFHKMVMTLRKTTTHMKKLRHCIKLRVSTPVDVAGVARQYVDKCVDDALNNQKSVYILQAIVALGADIFAGASGAASTANLYSYVDQVKNSTITCLTDTAKIQKELQERLESKFDAEVVNESHWISWTL